MVSAAALDELVDTLAALPVGERRTLPGIKPGRGDIILAAAVTLQTVLDDGGFAGIEATEAGLREGIFLARTILGEETRCSPTCARPRCATWRSSTSPTSPTPSTSRGWRCRCTTRSRRPGCSSRRQGEAELLWAAAMLHDVGMTISYGDHHKHSRYLIVSAELPGFDPRERALIAQMTRYHRKGVPKLGEWAKLGRPGDEEMLERCSMILRLAEHLERGRDQSVNEARLQTNGDGVALHLLAEGDLTLPRWSVERYGDDEAFERTFHRPLVIG